MFFIFSAGTRRSEKKQGIVADFCPLCRGVSAFRLFRIGLAASLYSIPFGGGKLLGHEIECMQCGLRLTTDPLKYALFAVESREAPISLSELERITFPKLREVYAARLALETQIARTVSVLNPDQRAQLLLEPFRLLNPRVEARYTTSLKLDRHSGLGCAGTLVLSFLFFAILGTVREPLFTRLIIYPIIFFGLGVVYTIWQLGRGAGRVLRSEIVRALARSLDPLEPTQEELQGCLTKCKAAGMKIGQKLRLPVLWAELARRAAGVVTTGSPGAPRALGDY